MKQRARVLSTIACIIMALLLVGGLVVTSLTTARVVPENPIHAPADRITLPEMLVAPDDSPGDAEGDFETTQPQEQQQQQQQTQTPTATAAPATVAASAASTSGNGSGSGSGSGTGEGTGEGGDDPAPTPVPQGGTLIETNLPGVNDSHEKLYSDDARVSEDTLQFYLRLGSLSNDGDRITDIVVYEIHVATNGGTTNNRIELPVNDDGNYSLPLIISHSYTITYKVVDAEGNERTEVVDAQGNRVPSSPFTHSFDYGAKLADDANPTVGEHPPTIELDLVDGQEVDREITLHVRATDYSGKHIAPGDLYSGVRVTINGEDWATYQSGVTGSGEIYPRRGDYDSYDLTFLPTMGDCTPYVIRVVAYDEEGNSAQAKVTVYYVHTGIGEVLGHVTIIISAPVLGVGDIVINDVSVREGESTPEVISRALQDVGYEAHFDARGYLNGIRCDALSGGTIPEDLRGMLENYYHRTINARVHETDFLEGAILGGSGWMYRVTNSSGSYSSLSSPDGLAQIHLSDGQTLKLLFTLAYGMDYGLSYYGSGFCGSWETGAYVSTHNFENLVDEPSFEGMQDVIRAEDENGCPHLYLYHCSACGWGSISSGSEYIPWSLSDVVYEPHDFQLTGEKGFDENDEEFYVVQCTHCGAMTRIKP